jgi:S1-C subfamily serine protease
MSPDQSGVLIRYVGPATSAAQVLQVDDVLMSIEGQAVANDGGWVE